MGDLSPHFSRSEFKDHRTGESGVIDSRLLDTLERIRALTGRPLRIVSGWRSAATNAAVGGAPDSQHLYGRAADLQEGVATVAEAHQAGAIGVGECHGWAVHVDTRPHTAPLTFHDCPAQPALGTTGNRR